MGSMGFDSTDLQSLLTDTQWIVNLVLYLLHPFVQWGDWLLPALSPVVGLQSVSLAVFQEVRFVLLVIVGLGTTL